MDIVRVAKRRINGNWRQLTAETPVSEAYGYNPDHHLVAILDLDTTAIAVAVGLDWEHTRKEIDVNVHFKDHGGFVTTFELWSLLPPAIRPRGELRSHYHESSRIAANIVSHHLDVILRYAWPLLLESRSADALYERVAKSRRAP